MRRSLLTIVVVVALLLPGMAVVVRSWAQTATQPPVATVVSITAQGQYANANVYAPRLSGQGRHVAFVTNASNLVDAPGQGSHSQVIVHELATRRNRLASITADGRAANAGSSYQPGSSNAYLSVDARYVAFQSKSTNLVAGDTNEALDVFVKDMESSAGPVRVSVTSAGAQTERLIDNEATGISADGRYVSFVSESRNLDGSTQRYRKLYVHDRQTATTTLASFPGKAVYAWASISADGRYAVWSNWGQPGGTGRPCPSGTYYDHGIFMRDLATGEVVTIASQPTRCTSTYGLYAYPSISADARFVAYVYANPDIPAEQRSQIYLYDRLNGTNTLVSADASGNPSNRGSTFPRLSSDGRSMAFFSASSNLVSNPVTSTSFLQRDMVTGAFSPIRLNFSGVPGWFSLSNYSDDSRRIAYVDGTSTSMRVYLVDRARAPIWTDAQVASLFGYRFGAGYASDPVNTATGNFTTTTRDLSFPEAVFGLDWSRSYNSLDQTAGPLGPGWTGGFDATVTEQAGGDVVLHDGDGRVVTFHPQGAGYDRPPDLPADLVRGSDGRFAIRYVAGTSAQFDANGRLARRERWDGQAVSFTYDAGRLTAATSSTGQTVSFAYDPDGRLTQATAGDGRTVTYAYQQGRLHQVRNPSGGVTTYDTDNAGRILKITGPDQRMVLANAYDQHGRVSRQDTPAGDRIDFTYDDVSNLTVVKNQATAGSVTYSHDLAGHLTGIVDPYGKVVRKSFDAAGNLVGVVDRRDQAASQEFDADGQVTRRVLPNGGTEAMSYDSVGRLLEHTDAAGVVTRHGYEGDERVPSTVTRSGRITRLDVQDGLVRSVEDADGVEQTFTYDAARNLVEVTSEGGQTTSYTYDAAGRRTLVRLPGGSTIGYTYDDAGRLVRETAPDGGVTSYSYDAAGRLISRSDPVGAETRYAYDVAGRLASETSPTGAVTAYGYDAAGRLTTVTRPGAATSRSTYDKLGARLSATSPTGAYTSFVYDADGNLTKTTGPGSASVTEKVNALGQVTERKDGLGRATTFEYDAAGSKVAEVDPAGGRTTFAYDADGNLTEITDPRGAVTKRRYSPGGRILAVEDPLGRATAFAYDPAGRLETTTDPAGSITTHGYDAAGRQTSTTTATGETTRYGYDAAGRVTAVTDPRGKTTRTSYDAAGRVTRIEDPAGAAKAFTYDQAGRLTSATDATGATTRYTYDERGNLSGRANPKQGEEAFGHDKDDRSTSYADPLARATRFGYDSAGRLTQVTDPSGRSVTLAYDAAGQLLSRTYGDGSKVSFDYDAAGRRTSMTDATRTTAYRYDQAGNLTKVTHPDGRSIEYQYDLAGQRTQMTHPDGTTVDYSYDQAGRLTGVAHSTAGSARFTYDNDGRLTGEQLPGGVSRAYGYDNGQLTSFEESGSGNDRNTTLAYDEAGRINAETTNGATRRFTYDPAGQLLSTRVDGGATDLYSYDAVGNRRTSTHEGAEYAYAYDAANQLSSQSVGGMTTIYTYDAAGRRVREEGDGKVRTIEYDPRGLPAKVTTTDEGTVRTQNRSYDGDGMLIAVTNGDGEATTTTGLVWDRAASLPQIITMTRAGVDTNLIYGHDRAFAVSQGAAVAFSRDVFGSTLRTAATADLVRADRYHPDGRPDGATGHTPAFGYRGELDLDGLLYLRARDYDPGTGAFTSIDPLDGRPGDVSEANPYPYAGNDPVNQLDPLGLSPVGNGELRLIGMMASWPGSMDWHSRKPRQFGGQMLESRGPHIPADCLIRVMPCFNNKGGFEPESTAKAHAIRELSDHRQSWINGINPLDAPVSDNVHWEVQIPGTVHDRADIIVDDDPDDVEADIYEAKQWTGPTSTFEEVEVQITRYMFMAAVYGSLNWSRGRELAEAGWAVTYEGPPEPGGLGWFLERPRWVAWAFPYHGHIYFAKWRNTPEHVQVRAKRLMEDPNWYWERLGVRIRVPVFI